MHTPIQLRLSLTTLAVLLLGMGLAAVLSWLAVEQLYLNTQQENLHQIPLLLFPRWYLFQTSYRFKML